MPSLTFEAIGTGWQIDTAEPVDAVLESRMHALIEGFDRTWSRFRPDSLVSSIALRPGSWPFPADAGALFDTYRRLYAATDGAVSPLVGRSLDALGYDAAYRLTAGRPAAAPAWDEASAWNDGTLTTVQPVSLDVGAAGKGYLVDLVGGMLLAAGHEEVVIDASGDIRHWGSGVLRVGLEHPLDTTRAIGIVRVANGAICSSATNRRTWGDGIHHVIDALTGLPTRRIIATWAVAATARDADGLATALFFTEPARLAAEFEFEWVRMDATGRVEFSPNLDGELFS